jgi:carboxyl-terminal processing protease
MIVDVTQNRGGDDRIARTIASRFTDRKRLAYIKHTKGGDAQAFYLYPAGSRPFLKPVYLMTSQLTGSAAEVFALAMHALPNVSQVGRRTGGALSDQLKTPLPNGWLLMLSNEIYLDPFGHLYESRGVPPDREIPIFDVTDPARGHAEAVRQVVSLATAGK